MNIQAAKHIKAIGNMWVFRRQPALPCLTHYYPAISNNYGKWMKIFCVCWKRPFFIVEVSSLLILEGLSKRRIGPQGRQSEVNR